MSATAPVISIRYLGPFFPHRGMRLRLERIGERATSTINIIILPRGTIPFSDLERPWADAPHGFCQSMTKSKGTRDAAFPTVPRILQRPVGTRASSSSLLPFHFLSIPRGTHMDPCSALPRT
jgi:hypothetical protein